MVCLSAVLAVTIFTTPSNISCWNLVPSVKLLVYPDVRALCQDICRSSTSSVKKYWNFTQVWSVSGSFIHFSFIFGKGIFIKRDCKSYLWFSWELLEFYDARKIPYLLWSSHTCFQWNGLCRTGINSIGVLFNVSWYNIRIIIIEVFDKFQESLAYETIIPIF